MKKIFAAILVSLVFLIGGCTIEKKEPAGAKDEISRYVCETDQKTGKQLDCRCISNPDKDKFTVIIAKGGIYDTDSTRQKLGAFLDSVKSDVGVENIGISYFEGSTIAELDGFIETLYRTKDVGYLIVIGGELDLMQKGNSALEALGTDLSLVGKEWNLPRDENGVRGIDPDARCREVAVSWVLPPAAYTEAEKAAFIGNVFDTYTGYHLNRGGVLSNFKDHYLQVQWENGHAELGMNLSTVEPGYAMDRVFVWNSEYGRVGSELGKKPYLLFYNVHGSPNMIGLGLNPNNESRTSSAVYTTLEEFSQFAKENGAPALLVQPASCGSMVSQYGEGRKMGHCCWPQIMLESGVWAYYSLGGGGDEMARAERAFSASPFFGYAIRNSPMGQYIFFGDITAHFRNK